VELRHLRYFVAAAETENVSRAALKLHVSQPALSRQIRDLEDEIGFCLLERTAKSVRLTDAGRAFLSDARALLQQADEAVKKARAIAGAEPTELKVGYSPAATARILPPILRAYQRVMPKGCQVKSTAKGFGRCLLSWGGIGTNPLFVLFGVISRRLVAQIVAK